MQINTLKIYVFVLLILSGISAIGQDKEKISGYLKTIEKGIKDTNLITAYNELATELMGSDDNKAKEYAFRGLKLSKELNHTYDESWSLNLIGLSYDYLAKPDSALYYYQESIKLKKQIKDVNGIGSVYSNIGVMYYFQNDFEKAIEYYNKARDQFKITQNEKGISGILNNIGAIYRQQKKYSQAISNYEDALKIKEKLKDSTGISNALSNLGLVYQYMGKYDKAEELQFRSIYIDSLRANKPSLVSSYVTLAELNFYKKNFDKAKKNLEKSIELSKEVNAMHYLDDAYKLYSNIDSITGDYKSALHHYKLYEYYKNQVLQQERSQQVDKLETIFSTKEKEQEINLLNAQSEIKELKIKEQKNQLLIFVIISMLLILLLAAVVWSYRNIKKQRKELQLKNELINTALSEKDMLLKEIHHRVKNNLQIISSLLSIQSRYIKDEKALEAINESKERVNAISLLHQEIYQNDVLKLINAKNYLENLITRIKETFDPTSQIELISEINETELDIDQLIPIGLIVNELLTNAYKYGSTASNPKIIFQFKEEKGLYLLSIKDNGAGFNTDDLKNKKESLGFKLIKTFALKLKGDLVIEGNSGTHISITFKSKNG
jgi:two-component sensor histidine kinase